MAASDEREQQLRARLSHALGADFEVRRVVCRSERADVYEVWDATIGRVLAVKVLRPDVEWTPAAIAAFRDVTNAVARLTHPNILPIHFVGDDHGLAYYARPFVDGESVDALVRRRGPLPLGESLAIALPVLDALEHAHQQGVAHGGLRPANILLDGASGRPLLADFGVARLAECAPAPVPAPPRAPEYASPEQAHGGRPADARSDVYGMAATLVQMTTAQLATRTDPYAPPAPGGLDPGAGQPLDRLPRWLVSVLMRGLAHEPRDRYPSAAAMAAALTLGRDSAATELVPVDGLLARLRGAEAAVPAAPASVPNATSPLAPAPPAAPAPGPDARPVARRRARPPLLPWLVLIAAVGAAAAGWLILSRPRLTITNALVLPVAVHVANLGDWTIAPGEQIRQRVGRRDSVAVRWQVVAPTAGTSAVGERLAGASSVSLRGGDAGVDIVAVVGDTAWFAPLITNAGSAPLRIVVNAGLATARDCGCAVPAGARRMPIGYYRLYANSTVQAQGAARRAATFRGFGPGVDRRSGAVGLRFGPGDLR